VEIRNTDDAAKLNAEFMSRHLGSIPKDRVESAGKMVERILEAINGLSGPGEEALEVLALGMAVHTLGAQYPQTYEFAENFAVHAAFLAKKELATKSGKEEDDGA